MEEGPKGLKAALDRIAAEAEQAVDGGYSFIVLSDRAFGPKRVPVSCLLAAGRVHHQLIQVCEQCGLKPYPPRTCDPLFQQSGKGALYRLTLVSQSLTRMKTDVPGWISVPSPVSGLALPPSAGLLRIPPSPSPPLLASSQSVDPDQCGPCDSLIDDVHLLHESHGLLRSASDPTLLHPFHPLSPPSLSPHLA